MTELDFDDFFKEIKADDIWDTGLETDFHTGLWFNRDIINRRLRKSIKKNKNHRLLIFILLFFLILIGWVFSMNIVMSKFTENKQTTKIERSMDRYEKDDVY